MNYGVCPLSVIPLRAEPNGDACLINQVLYGEHFKVIIKNKVWCKIRLHYDAFEGWVLNNQIVQISKSDYGLLSKTLKISSNLVEFIQNDSNTLFPVVLGSVLNCNSLINNFYDGSYTSGKLDKPELIKTALYYLNTPFLKGGKTPFGIDSSGLTQMVYKLNGYILPRYAKNQVQLGSALSFIEESEAGDLAFFDDNEGNINHVGIIMDDNYIIHCYGAVRIDRLDQTGIYNPNLKQHTHKLRVIKKII